MIITMLLDTVAIDMMNCSRMLIKRAFLDQGDGQAGGNLKSHLEEIDVA